MLSGSIFNVKYINFAYYLQLEQKIRIAWANLNELSASKE